MNKRVEKTIVAIARAVAPSHVIKLRDGNYYLVEGPTGYAFARGKARAKRFPTEQSALAFAKGSLTGDLTMIDVKEV